MTKLATYRKMKLEFRVAAWIERIEVHTQDLQGCEITKVKSLLNISSNDHAVSLCPASKQHQLSPFFCSLKEPANQYQATSKRVLGVRQGLPTYEKGHRFTNTSRPLLQHQFFRVRHRSIKPEGNSIVRGLNDCK
jgi:hypothetical protein